MNASFWVGIGIIGLSLIRAGGTFWGNFERKAGKWRLLIKSRSI